MTLNIWLKYDEQWLNYIEKHHLFDISIQHPPHNEPMKQVKHPKKFLIQETQMERHQSQTIQRLFIYRNSSK